VRRRMEMKRAYLLFCTVLLLFGVGQGAFCQWVATRITGSGAFPTTPKTFGGVVYWSDDRSYQNGYDEIRCWTPATGETVLTQVPVWTTLNSVWDETLVYERYVSGNNTDLYLYNASGGHVALTTAGGVQTNADLYQGTVAYEDHSGSVSRVMLWQESTGISTPVAPSSYEQVAPKIWGDRVVWQENRPSGARIYSYSPSEGTQLIGWGMSPGVYEDRIVAWTRAWWDDFDPFHQVYHPGTLWQWTPSGGIETLAEHSSTTGVTGTDMWGGIISSNYRVWDPVYGLTNLGITSTSTYWNSVVGVRDGNIYLETMVPEPSSLAGMLSMLTLSGLFWRKRRPG